MTLPVPRFTPTRELVPTRSRELYIDVFRGLMALLMVQGHLFESLLTSAARQATLYQWQMVLHGSTAPGFLFASGFVAGLPRSPLSLKASLRRARRLLFVLAVGYGLHLPFLSFWKSLAASPSAKAAFFACDALQAIALTQLFLLGLQWIVGRRWVFAAIGLALAVIFISPWVWAERFSDSLSPALAALIDARRGSQFPLFPYAAFVLAGTTAGALLGRQEREVRRRRARRGAAVLIAVGTLAAVLLHGRVDFWSVSPAYTLLRLGGLLLILQLVEGVTQDHGGRGGRMLALFGHQTLLVYCLHLYLLYGWVLGKPFLEPWWHSTGFLGAFLVLALLLPVLLAAAWVWHRFKSYAPHWATLTLVFLGFAFLYEFFTRPW